jgi:hypothetical protein
MMRLKLLEFLNRPAGRSLHLRGDMIAAFRPPADSGESHRVSGTLIMPSPHKGIADVLQVSGKLLRGMLRMPHPLMTYRGVVCGEFRRLR